MRWLNLTRRYKPVSSSDTSSESDEMLPASKVELDDDEASYNEGVSVRNRGRSRIFTLANVCSGVTFLLGLAMIVASLLRGPTDRECIRKLTVWSPLVEIAEMEEINFQNEFRQKTRFRGSPTPEIEKAWHEITHFAGVNIPVSKLSQYNKSDDIEWQLTPPDQGGGLFAGVEVIHQLHCLNAIRKFTWLDHYEGIPIGFSNKPEVMRSHIDHCLDSLRMSLMCNADLTPYFLIKDPSVPVIGGLNDFNVHHKCKKWDVITDWLRENAVNGDLLKVDRPRPYYMIKGDEEKTILT